MIMGGLTMHLICVALLLQPVKRHMKDAPEIEAELKPLQINGAAVEDSNNNNTVTYTEPISKH
jgi:hypothetical protein